MHPTKHYCVGDAGVCGSAAYRYSEHPFVSLLHLKSELFLSGRLQQSFPSSQAIKNAHSVAGSAVRPSWPKVRTGLVDMERRFPSAWSRSIAA